VMANRSTRGLGKPAVGSRASEREDLIGTQSADFIMASGAQPRIEQAVDMTAHDQSFHSLFPLRDRGVPDMTPIDSIASHWQLDVFNEQVGSRLDAGQFRGRSAISLLRQPVRVQREWIKLLNADSQFF